MEMEREEIEQLRKTVGCGAVLETSGFAVDVRESTRRAMKFRRESEIILLRMTRAQGQLFPKLNTRVRFPSPAPQTFSIT